MAKKKTGKRRTFTFVFHTDNEGMATQLKGEMRAACKQIMAAHGDVAQFDEPLPTCGPGENCN